MPPLRPASRALDPLLGLALVVAWSSGFIGAELGTRSAATTTVLAWRYVVATAVFVLLLAMTVRRWRPQSPVRQGVIGLLCQGVYLGGIFGGVGLGVPPGTAALIAAWQPLTVAVLEHVLLGRTTTVAQRVGLVLGVAGVALVVSSDIGSGEAPTWAYLLPLAGMLGLSLGTVLDRRWRLDDGVLQALTVQTAVVALPMVLGATAAGAVEPPAAGEFWAAIGWLIAFSTLGGYGLYFLVLRRSGATTVSTWLYLTPPATMLWAALWFGDEPGPLALAGTAVCAAAVFLAVRGAGVEPTDDSGERAAPAADVAGVAERRPR